MSKRKRKFKFVKTKGFLMLFVLFIFILLLTFFFGDSGVIEIIKARERIEGLKGSIAGLEIEKGKLKKEIEELKNNPLALERKAREKLWLMKKNEKVIVIVKNRDKKKNKSPGAKK